MAVKVAGKTDRHHEPWTIYHRSPPLTLRTVQQTTIDALTGGYGPPRNNYQGPPPSGDPATVETKKKTVFPKLSVPAPVIKVSPLLLRITLQHRRFR
jgi:hypothetical protein